MAAPPAQEQQYFVYDAIDKSGKKVSGELAGRNELSVRAELRRQGLKPSKVKPKPKSLFSKSKGTILPKDIAIFSRQLATMMSAGVPLVSAFDIVGRGHENPAMQELILGIKAKVEGGSALAEALAEHPQQFDTLYCNLVRAGEQAGILETLLHKIATYLEKTESLKAKIKKALFYPVAVMVVAGIVTAILLIFVVPTFEDLFKGFGAELPAFTQFVINLSHGLVATWYYVLGFIVAAFYTFKTLKQKSEAFNQTLDRVMLKFGPVGTILNKAAVARFARTLSTMSAAGVPLVEALKSVAGAAGNIVYYNAIMKMREDVSNGMQLQASMRQLGIFPNMVIQMVAIGEEAGSLDAMLGKVADFFEEEVDNAVDALTSLLEPMIMGFLGVVIGGLIIAMYLPIFKLGAVV